MKWILSLGVLIISFTAIGVVLSEASPVTVTFFRAAYAVPVLFAVKLVSSTPDQRTVRQRWFALLAGFALAADFVAWHLAIELIGAGLATVISSLHVIITMVAGWVLLRQRPTRLAIAATPVILFGVVLITGLVGSGESGEYAVLGVVLGVVSAALYTTFILLLRQSAPAVSSPVHSLLDATVGVVVGSLVFVPLDPNFSFSVSWPSHGWLIALALGAQVVGWLLINYALPRIEAWESSLLLVLQPVGTVTWAILIFDETFSITQVIGLVLVVSGVTIVAVSRSLKDPPAVDSLMAAPPIEHGK